MHTYSFKTGQFHYFQNWCCLSWTSWSYNFWGNSTSLVGGGRKYFHGRLAL